MFYYVVGWTVLIIFCFFYSYCNGADLNGRIHGGSGVSGFWKFHRVFFAEGFRLLLHDYFQLHCPWSWKTARKYRLAHMREFLGVSGKTNENLGHLTSADCDDPLRQEEIARGAFISRGQFWFRGVLQLLTAWLTLPFLFILALVISVIELLCHAWESVWN